MGICTALFNFGDLAHAGGIGFGQIHDFEQCRQGKQLWKDRQNGHIGGFQGSRGRRIPIGCEGTRLEELFQVHTPLNPCPKILFFPAPDNFTEPANDILINLFAAALAGVAARTSRRRKGVQGAFLHARWPSHYTGRQQGTNYADWHHENRRKVVRRTVQQQKKSSFYELLMFKERVKRTILGVSGHGYAVFAVDEAGVMRGTSPGYGWR